MNYGKKAEKLIEAGGAVPWKRSWKKRKPVTCEQASSFFGILEYGKRYIKARHLFGIRYHIKRCPVCKTIGGILLKSR